MTFELLIKNANIVDGSGTAAFLGFVGISNSRIQVVEAGEPTITANQVIDAQGMTLAPGFIDIHTHADRDITTVPTAQNYLYQGVTTVVGGNCGGSPLPVGEFLSRVSEQKPAINFATLVGHGSIRQAVMADPTGLATLAEIEEMKKVLAQALTEGAYGMSSGLEYIPGRWAAKDELVELNKVVANWGAIYSTHSRDEQVGILASLAEAIEVGKRSGVSVQISHIKACGAEVWGYGPHISAMICTAQALGVNIHCDQYPYGASNTGFSQCFPNWALEGGKEAFAQRVAKPELADKIKSYAANQLRIRIGEDPSKIQVSAFAADQSWEGKNLTQILNERGQEANLANLVDIAIEGYLKGYPSIIYHYIDPQDIRILMRNPYVMVASDGWIMEFGQGAPHPRSYGTFSRVLGRYVRDEHTLTLEEAVRKMSAMPAEKLGMNDRGMIQDGYHADLVIFDPDKIADHSTFLEPHQYSTGVHTVIVNGEITINNGQLTGIRAGKALAKK